jgi:hypothetical protein
MREHQDSRTIMKKALFFLFALLYLPASFAQVSIPQGFSSYASVSIGNGATCHSGAVLDEDGMNQKPFVYVDGPEHNVHWAIPIVLPGDAYQARITHCIRVYDALYVLMQADTKPQQALSQTLLRVLELNAANGSLIGSTYVGVPGVVDAYSSWVDKDNESSYPDTTFVLPTLTTARYLRAR